MVWLWPVRYDSVNALVLSLHSTCIVTGVNLIMPNGISCSYHLDESISNLRVVEL